MFSKLLKHELKSQAGLMGILSLAALSAGVMGGTILWAIIHFSDFSADDPLISLLSIFGMMVVMGVCFAIMAYATGVQILLLFRFYKHHFSDEGYLTFTLPVSTHQILLSSILNILIWEIITGLVTILGYAMVFTPIFQMGSEYIDYNIFLEVFSIYDKSIYIMQVVYIISAGVYGLILPLMSITIGAQVAKKHKLLAAFGIGYGLSTVISLISTLLRFSSLIVDSATSGISRLSDSLYSIFSMLIPSLLYLGIGIGGYFIMHHLIDKKLNLP